MNLKGLLSLFVVYIVWGSTYLAIRIGVKEGSGVPPFTFAMIRLLVASGILFLMAFLMKKRIRPTKKELIILLFSGVLLWNGGNGIVMWAEQKVDSGYAALMMGTMTIWVSLIERLLDRKRITLTLVMSLISGFIGIALLNLKALIKLDVESIVYLIFLLLAAISWGSGTLIQGRKKSNLNPLVSSAYQQLAGGIGFVVMKLIFNEPTPYFSFETALALIYLIIFGSVIAFTAFVVALKTLPSGIVMTYAYVNPVIALLLGWIVLDEKITFLTISGTILILLGVTGIFKERYGKKAGNV
ncbi:MAG: hypothetical protein PWQ48_109 [Thermotogaceae bacterium]|jgi:drug/metabolite transporter (DMT)-like permease|nr:hypothetical protein [Thermotogaceae bacterium]